MWDATRIISGSTGISSGCQIVSDSCTFVVRVVLL
jgi:hypothetical protein